MAHVCEICNKGELAGNNVSHSHLKTKRSWKPNIQRVRAIVDGEVSTSARAASVPARSSALSDLLRKISEAQKGAAAPSRCL